LTDNNSHSVDIVNENNNDIELNDNNLDQNAKDEMKIQE
jgi:hypothetical protein